jgi:hypothetical protein
MKVCLSASVLAVVVFSTPAQAQPMEYGTDRYGSDFMNIFMQSNGAPQSCRAACNANAECVAWTFVRSGYQGPQPRCWLKSAIPSPVSAVCCVSGVK